MGRRIRWAIAAALLGLANGPRDAAADPPTGWSVAWRRTCRVDLGGDCAGVDEREVSWCYGRFDARSGRYLGRQPQYAVPATSGPSADPPPPAPLPLPRGYARVADCDDDAALVRGRGRVELRLRGREGSALTFGRGIEPTACARSLDGARLAVATADGVTMHVRRGGGYVATARWTERGLAALAFVDGGRTLLGWRGDETLLTAWRVGAPVTERGLPSPDAPRSYACVAGAHGVPWQSTTFAYDTPPRAPRAEHGLLGWCDGADVYATDAAEFADFRADDRRWARAVAERYGGAAPRVWRAPWGDRVAAWTYRQSPQCVYDYRFEVRAVEHGDTLYRVIMETLHEAPAEMELFPDARYEVALGRGRMDALLRAMFDPSPPRRAHAAR